MSIAGDIMEEHYEDFVIPPLKDKIAAQEEYISFLEKEIGKNSSFLTAHGIICPEETVKEGERLREKIKSIKIW